MRIAPLRARHCPFWEGGRKGGEEGSNVCILQSLSQPLDAYELLARPHDGEDLVDGVGRYAADDMRAHLTLDRALSVGRAAGGRVSAQPSEHWLER